MICETNPLLQGHSRHPHRMQRVVRRVGLQVPKPKVLSTEYECEFQAVVTAGPSILACVTDSQLSGRKKNSRCSHSP